MASPLIVFIALIFGLCIGSFLNVCIHRIPLAESIVFPGSRCPECKKSIPYYDNLPLLSFVLLRGRCRNCGEKISLRYPLVELISGILAVASVLKFGVTAEAIIYYLFTAALLVVAFIDIDHRIIPDVISLPGIVACFLATFLLPMVSWKDSLIGILSGGGLLYLIAIGYSFLRKAEGMGGGDIKLLAMIGGLTGISGVFFTVFVSSATGTLVGIAAMIRSGKGMRLAIPFGPFLSLGAVLYVFFGPELIHWYVNIAR